MERRGERWETIISVQKNSTHQLLERVFGAISYGRCKSICPYSNINWRRCQVAYFRICKFCGDRLDPGEHCDCRDRKKIYVEQFKQGKNGQLVLPLKKEAKEVC